MALFSDQTVVPVVMFHSVGLEMSHWSKGYLSEPLDTFERKLALLKRQNTVFFNWYDLYDYMQKGSHLSNPKVMLTFDDGYLDNWVYVFPLLKRYDVKATIFVNPDFVDPRDVVRPTLEDVCLGNIKPNQLKKPLGFLTWQEMRMMEASGLVDIQSHALTHTWYFCTEKIVDFHHPGDDYPWLAWNAKPERKPFYMIEDQDGFIPWGCPIYEYQKSLICRRYFPPAEVTDSLMAFVNKHGGSDFFKTNDWRVRLHDQHTSLMERYNARGRFESENEYQDRIYFELETSKKQIEANLNKQVDFICWPGGAYNDTVISLARSVGYKAWTLSSRDQSSFRNRPNSRPDQIKRVGSAFRYRNRSGKDLGAAGVANFLFTLERHKGSLLYKWLGRLMLTLAWFRTWVIYR